jgi:hypothetical protein
LYSSILAQSNISVMLTVGEEVLTLTKLESTVLFSKQATTQQGLGIV